MTPLKAAKKRNMNDGIWAWNQNGMEWVMESGTIDCLNHHMKAKHQKVT